MVVFNVGRAKGQDHAPSPNPQPNSYTDFCSRSLVGKSCPSVPTLHNVDLNALLGSYYEIGSTARYKLQNELGSACTHTNFSIDRSDVSSSNSVSIINVLSSSVPVVHGQQTLSALTRIANTTFDICSNIARLCSVSSPQSKLSEASLRVSTAATELHIASDIIGSSTLNEVARVLNSSILSGVHTCLDRISRSVNTMVTILVSGFNQGAGASVALDPLVHSIRTSIGTTIEEANELSRLVVYNLTSVGALIDQVLSRPILARMTNARELLKEALLLVDQGIDDIIDQVATLEGQLITIDGPLVEMVAVDYRTNIVARESNTKRKMVESTNMQSSINEGKVLLHNTNDDMNRFTFNTSTLAQPLQIVALEGGFPTGLGEYSTLLVYTCEINARGDPSIDLMLLSRTPTVTPQSIIHLLSIASSYGIFTDCDNPLVPTLQRPDRCVTV